MDGQGLLSVRSTVALNGLVVGAVVRVDPADPDVADLLEAAFLVPHPVSVRESQDGAPTPSPRVDGRVDG